MKVTTFLILATLFLVGFSQAQDCAEDATPRCYCASEQVDTICDVTVRSANEDQTTAEECATYCTDTCGDNAGSTFSCITSELLPCTEASTTCECTCADFTVEIPSPIQFGGQCSAFCKRSDVCGADAGSEFTCPDSAAFSSISRWFMVASSLAATSVVAALMM